MPDESETRADEDLLSELHAALSARRQVPDEVVEAGKAAFAWHDFDAEIARLVLEPDSPAGSSLLRAEPASVTAVTFRSAHLVIELEAAEDALIGQLVPDQEARIEMRTRANRVCEVLADEVGGFTIRPIPRAEFHLRVRTSGGLNVVTTWVTI